jgi:pilus assembly protein CpaB
MRAKSLALLVLALGCGLIASLGITQVMAKRGTEPAVVAGETEPVFVAAKEISMGDALKPQMLKSEAWPKDKVPSGALGRIEDIEGRQTRGKIYVGEPILDNKLFAKGDNEQGAHRLIPKGYRVVAVRVDSQSSGGDLLVPGARVDVLLHVNRNAPAGFPQTTTKMILQDIKVFAVNNIVSMESSGQDTKSIAARTVSLLVTPVQAQRLTMGSELGSIRLAMRGSDEDSHQDTPATLATDLGGRPEAADRVNESLEAPKSGAAKNTFQEFLDAMTRSKTKQAPTAGLAPSADDTIRYTMRILAGSEIRDINLEAGNAAAADGDSGLWKVSGLKPPAAASVNADKELAEAKKTVIPPGEPKPSKAEPSKNKESKSTKDAKELRP